VSVGSRGEEMYIVIIQYKIGGRARRAYIYDNLKAFKEDKDMQLLLEESRAEIYSATTEVDEIVSKTRDPLEIMNLG
jgi:hypothetical protein